MPRLTVFVPCERVIIAQGDNTVSLIVVIQEFKFEMVGAEPIVPKETAAFVRCSIYCQWFANPDEQGQTFEQKIMLGRVGGKTIIESVAEFTIEHRTHRTIANVSLLPFLEPGDYSLSVSVRHKGEQDWPQPAGEYPLVFTHSKELVVKQ